MNLFVDISNDFRSFHWIFLSKNYISQLSTLPFFVFSMQILFYFENRDNIYHVIKQ